MSDAPCPACSGSKIVTGRMQDADQFSFRFAPASCSHPRVTPPEALRTILRSSGWEIAKQEIDEIDHGPCRDLPNSDCGRMVGASIWELDKLARAGRSALLRRYRDMRGVRCDVAAKEATHWRQLTREEKLELFGWVAKVKPPKDDLRTAGIAAPGPARRPGAQSTEAPAAQTMR